jgi:predicted amidohydrolase
MTHPAEPFTVAVVQDSPAFLNLHEGVEKTLLLLEKVAETGARIVVFPETWLPGYPVWLDWSPGAALWDHAPAKAIFNLFYHNSIELNGPHAKRLAQAAKTYYCTLVLGVSECLGGALFNSILYFGDDGQLAGVHRKLMPTYTERLLWSRGDGSTLTVIETEWGRIGGLICWEHWMPLACSALHAKNELIHAALWPALNEMNLISSRHYAFGGQCFVAAAGAVLRREELSLYLPKGEPAALAQSLLESIPEPDSGFLLRGGSAIISPTGRVLTKPIYDAASIITAAITSREHIEARLALDTTGHYARPDVFRLEVDERPQRGVITRRVSE